MITPQTLFAETALLPGGWSDNVRICIDGHGVIADVASNIARTATDIDLGGKCVLPAPANLHSHGFQRAMAGMTERRGPGGNDSFWTWRKVMYQFLDRLNPDQIEAIAALAFMEMAEAGYGSVVEFHYLHHQRQGTRYDAVGELSDRILAAAESVGIGLTLLPVLYQHAGCKGEALKGGQRRFGCSLNEFAALFSHCEKAVDSSADADNRLGLAAHSLRAVGPDGLDFAVGLAESRVIHMHIAEQEAEIAEVMAAHGARPVEWLLDHHDVNDRWCLIHCTHMNDYETQAVAKSGAVAGLCSLTESSLGDGLFRGADFLTSGGRIGMGTDSNIEIGFFNELKTLEYSQRLRDRKRAIFASRDRSTGRVLFDAALKGGAQAASRPCGCIAPGQFADLIAMDTDNHWLDGARGDEVIDRMIFAAVPRHRIRDVWSAGRKIVSNGVHGKRDRIIARYRAATRLLFDCFT
ncbi:MAG: formimidoylglutamate deiminase [Hyphomicrobiales bacterium]